ncbi:MAG TPA: glycosyltransferase family 2 protein [Mycobacteriales bacterium]|nr:glycosyltransferase family 2 protein [Mycobacteriales bacterium]
MSVTIVIATYNRCPFPPGAPDRNPLSWTLRTLLESGADDILVVDDGSTDHTADVLSRFDRVRSLTLAGHRGVAAARNAGWWAARRDAVMILDDDCLVSADFVPRCAAEFEALQRHDPAVGALTLPYYNRSRTPRAAVPAGEFGSLDIHSGYFTSNFDCVPDAGILTPIPTTMVSGVCLFDRRALRDAGGYLELPGWKTSYCDHLELSAQLLDTRWTVRHLPDPALAVTHLKYGAAGDYAGMSATDQRWQPPGVGRTLADLVRESARPRADTGGRTEPDAALEEMIALFFSCYARRSPTGAKAWAERTYRDYVLGGRSYTAAYRPTESEADRRARWHRAIAAGVAHAISLSAEPVHPQIRRQAAVDGAAI